MLASAFVLPLLAAVLQSAPAGRAGDVVERPVTVGTGEWAVPGVLALPTAPGRHAAVLLLHGSGPGPADNLKEEALGLARRGIVTLRYTKRSTAHAAKFRALGRRATIAEEHLDDALLGVALLRGVAEVDTSRIFVVGHSQSTSIAPVVAERVPLVAGVALVAAAARPAAEMIESQVRYVSSLSPGDTAAERGAREVLAGVARMRDPATPDTATVLGVPMAYWRDTVNKNTEQRVERLLRRGARVLVVHGGRDYLVTDEDFAAWQRRFAGVPGIVFRRFANLNHMMQAGEGRMRPEEYRERRPVSPDYLDALARWIDPTALAAGLFDYAAGPVALADSLLETREGVELRRVRFPSPRGGDATGVLVVPTSRGPHAGIVMGHGAPSDARRATPWAVYLARHGAVVLVVDSPFARRDGNPLSFSPRDSADLVQQVVDYRRALDILAARADVDPRRLGYVGVSHGGMVGALLAGAEPRLRAVVLNVGGPGYLTRFRKTDGAWSDAVPGDIPPSQLEAWAASLAPLDARQWIARSTAALLLQNGLQDPAVEPPTARALHAAAPAGTERRWYESGHLLPPQAYVDEVNFLARTLGTTPPTAADRDGPAPRRG